MANNDGGDVDQKQGCDGGVVKAVGQASRLPVVENLYGNRDGRPTT
jgi:hypothetical protein